MQNKRVLVIADLHCGHRAGLTPPSHWGNVGFDKWADLRKTLWLEFARKVDELKPIDILFINGDTIDGRSKRNGGVEILTSSIAEQQNIAVECINYIDADQIVMTRGTPYHVDLDGELGEDAIAKEVGAIEISDQCWPEVNGVIFDLKHKIGGSSVPHNKGLSLGKAQLWNLVHNDFYASQPRADIIIRSHVHYYYGVDGGNWHGFITPSLQGLGSGYGSRICEGLVHFGFMWFDIVDKQNWEEKPRWNRWYLTGGVQRKGVLTL